jgi:hypothetical protein
MFRPYIGFRNSRQATFQKKERQSFRWRFGTQQYTFRYVRHHKEAVITARELLETLDKRGVAKADIARALGIGPARVTEMYQALGLAETKRGGDKPPTRRLLWDEGYQLIQKFGLKVDPRTQMDLPSSIAQLAVLAVANALGSPLDPDDPKLPEIAADFQAFLRFVADPKVRESTARVEGFLEGLRMSRNLPQSDPASPPEGDSSGT